MAPTRKSAGARAPSSRNLKRSAPYAAPEENRATIEKKRKTAAKNTSTGKEQKEQKRQKSKC